MTPAEDGLGFEYFGCNVIRGKPNRIPICGAPRKTGRLSRRCKVERAPKNNRGRGRNRFQSDISFPNSRKFYPTCNEKFFRGEQGIFPAATTGSARAADSCIMFHDQNSLFHCYWQRGSGYDGKYKKAPHRPDKPSAAPERNYVFRQLYFYQTTFQNKYFSGDIETENLTTQHLYYAVETFDPLRVVGALNNY